MFSKSEKYLLLRYIFIYPAYYVGAMLFATLLIAPLKGWSYEAAKSFFIVIGICMWVASYLIHYQILFYAISNLKSKKL